MSRHEAELLRFAKSILNMANDLAVATAGTAATSYARQDARMNQGTVIVFVVRDPEVAAAMEAGVAAHYDVGEIPATPKADLN